MTRPEIAKYPELTEDEIKTLVAPDLANDVLKVGNAPGEAMDASRGRAAAWQATAAAASASGFLPGGQLGKQAGKALAVLSGRLGERDRGPREVR